jgi:hypothetical protein
VSASSRRSPATLIVGGNIAGAVCPRHRQEDDIDCPAAVTKAEHPSQKCNKKVI